MKKLFIVVLITIILLSIYPLPAARAEDESDLLKITSVGAIVIDFETGEDLYVHNADVKHNPASMTKMMTIYLVYEAIANGDITMETAVPISARVVEYSRNPAWTNVPLVAGGKYYVEELIDSVIVCSAGGAAIALAELTAGSESAFVKRMNDKVAEWGIDAYFQTPSGGPEATYVTPRAMAEIVRHSIMDFPEILEKTAMTSVTFRGYTYPSTNHLLGVYEGIDGFKTGTNTYSKENFSATAKRGDARIIAVTMGSNYGKRFDDTKVLLDYGFSVVEEILEARRAEQERIEQERLEEERLEAERLEAERLEAERLEAERIERERIETERLETERREAERLLEEEAERQERERAEAEAAKAQEAAQAQKNRYIVFISAAAALFICVIIAVVLKLKNRRPKGKRVLTRSSKRYDDKNSAKKTSQTGKNR